MTRTLILFFGIVCLSLGCGPVPGEDTQPAGEAAQVEEETGPTLYERLGGVYAIASVVDELIERVSVNEILNANSAIDEARTRVPKPGLKFHVTAMVCQATGGPEQYTGRSMKASHLHLSITEEEWEAFSADFQATLDKFQVPKKEQNELLAIVESTKGDIVMPSSM